MTQKPTPSFAKAPCGLFQARDDGTLLQVNDYLADLYNVRSEALRGSYLDRLFTRPSRVILHTHVIPTLKLHNRIEEVEVTLELPHGERITALLNATREPHESEPACIHGVLFCMRQRRDLGAQLVSAQRVIEHVPGMLFQLLLRKDGSSALPYVSPGITTLHGLAAQDVHDDASAFWDTVDAEDLPALRAGLKQASEQLTLWHGSFRAYARGELRWLDGQATPHPQPDGSTLFYGYLSDVTERMSIEEIRREVAVADRATQAKTRFVARVSHELRNPLTCLLGFSELLAAEEEGVSPRSREMLRNIEVAAHSLQELVDDLLDLSAIESGTETLRLENLKIARVVAAMVQLIAPVAQTTGVKLDVDIAPELLVRADDRRLRQVVLNLLSNAVKYNRVNGLVLVRALERDGRVLLSVRDQGKGMTQEQLSNLFQPFNRLGADASTVRGTGLGLVITRTLVEHMDGVIEVDSTVGEGSCFTVSLPPATP